MNGFLRVSARTVAVSAAAGAVLVAALALFSQQVLREPKSALVPGDEVMYLAPAGDKFSWSGPHEIVSRTSDQFTLDVDGERVTVDGPEVMTVDQHHARAASKESIQ